MEKKDMRTIKKEHFQNLVAVAYADGSFSEEEMHFLAEKAVDFGLDNEIVDAIIKRAPELEFEVPLNDFEREDQLSDVVFMSMVDGNVAEKEYNLCLKIAEKLEFTVKDLDQVIELTAELWDKEKQ
jgi:uncharacterized tellurite resistance protein B-like protein